MLNLFRNKLKNSKLFIWLILVPTCLGLVAYLGYYFLGDGPTATRRASGDWVAQVNGSEIPGDLFRRTAQNTDSYLRAIYQDQYDQYRSQLQIGRRAANELIYQEIMRQEAVKAGLIATEEELRERILEDPSFKDPQTQAFVGMERYERIVARNFGTIGRYESFMRDRILADKWQDMVTATATVSADEVRDLYIRRNVKTVVDYVVVPSGEMELSTEISDADLEEYHQANGDRYRRPEGRSLRYALIDRNKILESIEVTDEELRNYYDVNAETYNRPAERQASHILFRVDGNLDPAAEQVVREEAEQVLARIKAGEDFATLARTVSQDQTTAMNGGELGWFPRYNRMVEPFAAAAFELQEGEVSGVVRTDFGYHIIKVTGVRDEGLIPYEDLQDEIKNTLELQKAQERVEALAEKLASASTSVAALEAAAGNEGLDVQSLEVRVGENRWDEVGVVPNLVDRAMNTAVGESTGPIQSNQGILVAVVESSLEPSVAPLEEVLDRVRTDLLNDRLLEAAYAEAKSAFDQGGGFEGAVSRLDREVQDSGDLAPNDRLDNAGNLTDEMRAVWFADEAQIGDEGVVRGQSGAIVYRVTDRIPFNQADFEAAKASLEQELINERRSMLLDQILNDLRKEYAIVTNDELIQSIGA